MTPASANSSNIRTSCTRKISRRLRRFMFCSTEETKLNEAEEKLHIKPVWYTKALLYLYYNWHRLSAVTTF